MTQRPSKAPEYRLEAEDGVHEMVLVAGIYTIRCHAPNNRIWDYDLNTQDPSVADDRWHIWLKRRDEQHVIATAEKIVRKADAN